MDLGGMTLVRPVCIPTVELEKQMLSESKTKGGRHMKDCYLSGHGDTNGTMVETRGKRTGMDQTILQKGIIPVYDQQKCAKTLEDEAFYTLSNTQMCAFDSKAEKGDQVDACQGDSGGPFVCPLADDYL